MTPLTPGEVRVLEAYVAMGSVKLAAHELGLSPQTVKNHLMNAREKTGLRTPALIYEATLKGWLRVRRPVA